MTPLIDLILITWNGRVDTLAALDSIEKERSGATDGALRVTLVDNGSTDGTIEDVRRRHPSVRIVRLKENRGFTGGIAAGVEVASAAWLAFVNNDAVMEPGWLDAMTHAAESAPDDVIAIAGKIVSADGERVDFYRGHMTFDGHGFQQDYGRPVSSVAEPPGGSEMLFACGGNMLVRREPFIALGGFDDDFFAYLEDVDFGWRSWLAGWRTTWLPSASIRHHSSATSNRLGNFERGVLFERNAAQTVIKNYADGDAAAALSATWLTMLHRAHVYTVDRNSSTEPLTRAPFGSRIPAQRPDLRTRLTRLIWRDPDAVVIHDPLTRMQFRAIDWLFRHMDELMAKRARVQAMRRIPDEEIFARFPLAEVPTYHGDERLMASELFRIVRGPYAHDRRALGDMIKQ